MLRPLLHNEHEAVDSDGIRLRGLGFSRLDAFSDVVFGFALTLLVVSLEVPRNFEELHHLWGAFLPFGISFLLLMLIWYEHFIFFRRYGMHDGSTVWLNGLLLFVVLFYVYPLKFLFLTAFNQTAALAGWRQMTEVVLLFAGGLSALYFLFAALYANAYRLRDKLHLSPAEAFVTRNFVLEEGVTGCIGVLVCLLALLLPRGFESLACLAFMLIGVWKAFMGRRTRRAVRRRWQAEDRTSADSDSMAVSDAASIKSE